MQIMEVGTLLRGGSVEGINLDFLDLKWEEQKVAGRQENIGFLLRASERSGEQDPRSPGSVLDWES